MAIAQVQKNIGASNATVASLTVSFAAPPTEDNFLVAMAQRRNVGGLTGPAGWSEVWNFQATDFGQSGLWFLVAGAAESSDVQVGVDSNNGDIVLAIAEYSGLVAAPFDVSATNSDGTLVSSLSTGTTATTAQADELLIASMGVRALDATAWGWTNSFSHQANAFSSGSSSLSLGWAHRIVSATLAAESTASWSGGSARAGGGIATFKADAGGGVSVGRRRGIGQGIGRGILRAA